MKTAVEWFYDEIKHIVPNDYVKKYEQAKDLEMTHLAQAFEDGEHNYFYSKKTGEDFESGVEYYNEKFKKDEQMNEHDELRTYTKFQHWLATNYNNLPTTSGEMTKRAIKYLQEVKESKELKQQEQ